MKRWSSYILFCVFSIALSLPLLVHEHESHHCEEEHDGAVVHNNAQEHHSCLLFNGQLAGAFDIATASEASYAFQFQVLSSTYFAPYSFVLVSLKQSRAPPTIG